MKRLMSRLPLMMSLVALVLVTGAVVTAENKADRARLLETRACSGCDLTGTNLSPYDLTGISAPSALMSGAILYRSTLKDADLRGADLSRANLRGANLTNAKLAGANLDGADLSEAVGANLALTTTTAATKCPNGSAGPCQ